MAMSLERHQALAEAITSIEADTKIRRPDFVAAAAAEGLTLFGTSAGLSHLTNPHGAGSGKVEQPTRETLIAAARIWKLLDRNKAMTPSHANALIRAVGYQQLSDLEKGEIFGGTAQDREVDLSLGFDPVKDFGPGWKQIVSNRPRVTSGFRFFILSGASAAGKDTLLDRVVRRDGSLSVLKKRTTRPLRGGEAFANVEHTPVTEFRHRLDTGRIVFPYELQKISYGFSTRELVEAIHRESSLFAVFTELDLVPKVVRAMNSIGLPTKAFFIRAGRDPLEERDELEIRTLQRGFNKYDRGQRLERIDKALRDIAARPTFDSEYDRVEYGRGDNNESSTLQLLKAIQEFRDEPA